MTSDEFSELIQRLDRIAEALERMSPRDEPPREKLPAVLGTAIYSREEREKQELKKGMRG